MEKIPWITIVLCLVLYKAMAIEEKAELKRVKRWKGSPGVGSAGSADMGEMFRGTAGVDYPNYKTIPTTNFRCSEHEYEGGHYADVETQCQVYHVCHGGRKDSFLCGRGTVFNQQILACDYWYSTECDTAPSFYYLNSEIGKRGTAWEPKEGDSQNKPPTNNQGTSGQYNPPTKNQELTDQNNQGRRNDNQDNPGAGNGDQYNPETRNNGKDNSGIDNDVQDNPKTGDDGLYNPGTGDDGLYKPGTGDDGLYNPGTGDDGLYNPGTGDDGLYNPGPGNDGYDNPETGDNYQDNPETSDDNQYNPITDDDGQPNDGTGNDGQHNHGTGNDHQAYNPNSVNEKNDGKSGNGHDAESCCCLKNTYKAPWDFPLFLVVQNKK